MRRRQKRGSLKSSYLLKNFLTKDAKAAGRSWGTRWRLPWVRWHAHGSFIDQTEFCCLPIKWWYADNVCVTYASHILYVTRKQPYNWVRQCLRMCVMDREGYREGMFFSHTACLPLCSHRHLYSCIYSQLLQMPLHKFMYTNVQVQGGVLLSWWPLWVFIIGALPYILPEMQICHINTIYIKKISFFLSAISFFVLNFLLFNAYSIILVWCVFPWWWCVFVYDPVHNIGHVLWTNHLRWLI